MVSTAPAQDRESFTEIVPSPAAGAQHVAGAGNPFGIPGDLIPPDETRVPAPARRDGHIRDTPCQIRATCWAIRVKVVVS